MSDYLISLFIDDEMDLDEKINFVEEVHASDQFFSETIGLLEQEKSLLEIPLRLSTSTIPKIIRPAISWIELLRSWWPPATGFATAMLLAALGWLFIPQQPTLIDQNGEYRFVLYQPKASHAEIIGTFTDWSPVPMEKVGTTGYWALSLEIPQGEHRYSYLVENVGKMADPSVAAREHDDFGGENSVIIVGREHDPVS